MAEIPSFPECSSTLGASQSFLLAVSGEAQHNVGLSPRAAMVGFVSCTSSLVICFLSFEGVSVAEDFNFFEDCC